MEGVLLLKSASLAMSSPQDSSDTPLDAKEDSHLQVPPVTLVMHATVAPPPPPPPPPPLPPPPPTSFDCRDVQRRSMKRLNWDTIPSHNVVGKLNVWTSKRPQRDLVLDIRSMEELFSHVDKRASLRSSRVVGLRKYGSMDLVPQEPRITILDSKRSMNIGIFLRHFKRPVKEIVEDVRQGNWLRFGPGKLRELCKLLPEESEVKQLRSFRGNVSTLPEADQFMVQLIRVAGYEERLKTMVLREEFFPLLEEVKISIAVMTKAANELLDCDDLHSVIRLVLKAGNYMNAGGYSANAIGFRMASLLKLADTKANKPGMNLMHYVAKQAEDIDAELLTFPRQLDHIGMASRICKSDVITDFEGEVEKIKEVKLFSSSQPGLLQQFETFLMRAEAKIADIETSLQELNVVSHAVAEYFCEDPATFKLEECCSIFNSFCRRFDTAVQENREREAAEQRHKRKESMRISVKRRSTVSCSEPEHNTESSSLESALHNLLSSVPGSITRCRKNMLPPAGPSLSEHSCQTAEKAATTSRSSQESPDKKQVKLQKEGKRTSKLEDKEVEKMREVTRMVLDFQKRNSSLDGDKVSGSPHHPDREQGKPATPSTPLPRTRDFFFANNGDVGSPWTILSPITCPQRDNPLRNRQAHQRRISWASNGEKPADGVWKSDENYAQPSSCSQNSRASPSAGSTSLPEYLRQRVLSQGPVVRSASVDETMRSPAAGFRLGGLFQRSTSQRSYSSGSRTANIREDGAGSKAGSRVEGQASTSGFITFFRRIGGRSKPGDLEEQNFKGSNT